MDSPDKTIIDFRRLRPAPLPEGPWEDGQYLPVLTVDGGERTLQWADIGDLIEGGD